MVSSVIYEKVPRFEGGFFGKLKTEFRVYPSILLNKTEIWSMVYQEQKNGKLKMGELSEQELWLEVQKGNEKCFEVLFKRYYAVLCGYSLKVVKNQEDAENCVQETFVKLWEKRGSIQIESSLKSYLFKMVFNQSVNHLSVQRRMVGMEVGNENSQEVGQESSPMDFKETEHEVAKAIAMLPPMRKAVFLLSRVEEKSYKEIAGELQLSIKTVENHIGAALKQLRVSLKDVLVLVPFVVFVLKIMTGTPFFLLVFLKLLYY